MSQLAFFEDAGLVFDFGGLFGEAIKNSTLGSVRGVLTPCCGHRGSGARLAHVEPLKKLSRSSFATR